MNSIVPGVSDTIPTALEAVRLALSHVSPVEAGALTLGWVALAVALAYSPRPVVSLNARLADEAADARAEVTR